MLFALFTAHSASLSLRIANPVAVPIAPDLRVLGVAHRNLPHDEERFPTLTGEALHSGEPAGADTKQAAEAVTTAASFLSESGRFDIVELGALEPVDRKGLFGEPLAPSATQALCAASDLDAIVVLEGLDSEVSAEEEAVVRTGTDAMEVRQTVKARALWRTYLCDGTVVDDNPIGDKRLLFEDRAYADTVEEAWESVPDLEERYAKIGSMSGQLYARRLAPSWATAKRRWIPGGSDGLKKAKVAIEGDDWEGAITTWGEAFDTDTEKPKGKAAFNLAVAAERSGELALARQWIQLAAEHWPSGKVDDYAFILERRWKAMLVMMGPERADLLEEQIPANDGEADRPLAIPADKAVSQK